MKALTAGQLLLVAVLLWPAAAGCLVLRFEKPVEYARRRIDRPQDARATAPVELKTASPSSEFHSDVDFAEFTRPDNPNGVAGDLGTGHSVADAQLISGDARTLTFDRLVNFALAQNPDLQAAAERIAIADATLSRARADFFPKLGIKERYGVSDIPQTAFAFQLNQQTLDFTNGFSPPGTTVDFHTQLVFEQSLYTGGRRSAERFAAEAKREAAVYDLSALHNELMYRLAESYYRLIQAHSLVSVRTESVRQVEQHLQIARSRYDAGQVVKSDVLSVQVRLAEVREALQRSRNELQLAWAILENVAGCRIPLRVLPITVPEAPLPVRLDDVVAAVSEALHSRPETARITQLQLAAVHEIDAAHSADLPSVDLIADYDVYTGDLQKGNDAFFAGIVVSLNLFDAGRTRADVRRALARVRAFNAEQRRLALDIELDVRRAFLQLDDARQRVALSTEAVSHARESLREIEVQYRARMTTVTQLIDAQVALSDAQVRLANASANVAIARMAAARAAGRLSHLLSD